MKFIEVLFPQLAGQTWAVIAINLSIAVVFYLLLAISWWKMFTKMGEKGWKAFIPVYNVYILLKKCSKVSYIWQFILFGIIYSVVDVLYYGKLLPDNSWLYWVCLVAQLISSIWLLVIEIKFLHGISRSFGHGAGFTIGLMFLAFIFQLILGFGKSEYRPVNEK